MGIAELPAFCVKNNASDLYLSAGLPSMTRVDGEMRRIKVPLLEHKKVHLLIDDIMNDKHRRDYEESQETDFSFELSKLVRFQANALNQGRRQLRCSEPSCHRFLGCKNRAIPNRSLS
jgi:twitching motility protein PilT